MKRTKRCIVHIGMHKTGSSSIQASLYAHLKSDLFEYARVTGTEHGNHGLIVQLAFMQRPWTIKRIGLHQNAGKKRALMRQGRARSDLESAIDTAAQSGKTLILSGEGIGALNHAELIRMKALLDRYFDKITIVSYVRPPQSYIQSIFQERLKRRGGHFNIARHYPNYRSRFGKFDQLFGAANVMLWKFAPELLRNKCVVQDFCHRMGIDFSASGVMRRNESLSAEATACLYAYRKYAEPEVGMAAVRKNIALVKALAGIKGSKLEFSESVLSPITATHREDLEWMEQRLGTSLDEDISDAPHAVTCEQDLLDLAVRSSPKLLQIAPHGVGVGNNIRTPQEVASLVHTLRDALMSGAETVAPGVVKIESLNQPGSAERLLYLDDIVRDLKGTMPAVMDGMDEWQTVALLSAALRKLRREIRRGDGGSTIYVPSLGAFRIGKMTSKKGATIKRFIYNPVKTKFRARN